jgi:thiosulfate dehydrogenase
MKVYFFITLFIISISACVQSKKNRVEERVDINSLFWQAPDSASMPNKEVRYGRELIAKTAYYLGPRGIVDSISNGMNCQNCHLEAGTKPFGNNYGSVASLYPKFRARSGGLESIEKRVNDCIQRSLNGKPLDSLAKEMRAMVAYITWLGKDVPKGKKADGSGLKEIKFLNRAADSVKGKLLYEQKCVVCHHKNGQGILASDQKTYIYPPLWGKHSFNTAAGLFRISNFAKYIRANMPQGATHDKPLLTEEEAWDISAYVISLPRPRKDFKEDWPKITTKPFDHPFGPYADSLSEEQHKFGPWGLGSKR